jgi:hypothetical protein
MSDDLSPTGPAARVVRFGTFALYREKHQLVDGDREIHLSPKAYSTHATHAETRQRAR